MSQLNDDEKRITVFFDGSCPLCRREINAYKRLKESGYVNWIDVSAKHDKICAPHISTQKALKRFHIMLPDGSFMSGAAAFAKLWMVFPRLYLFGYILSLPGIRHFAEILYQIFLVMRPLLQRIVPK
ncbi:MAG: hypothetical protein TECD_00822 [Hyphomicrobiaceae bacterium hypho_1]